MSQNNLLFLGFMNNIDEFRSADFGKYLLESKMVAAGKEKFMEQLQQ
jgi:hypothetical protein